MGLFSLYSIARQPQKPFLHCLLFPDLYSCNQYSNCNSLTDHTIKHHMFKAVSSDLFHSRCRVKNRRNILLNGFGEKPPTYFSQMTADAVISSNLADLLRFLESFCHRLIYCSKYTDVNAHISPLTKSRLVTFD